MQTWRRVRKEINSTGNWTMLMRSHWISLNSLMSSRKVRLLVRRNPLDPTRVYTCVLCVQIQILLPTELLLIPI